MDEKKLFEREDSERPMSGKMPAGRLYPERTHAQETARIILSGEMTLTMSRRVSDVSRGKPLLMYPPERCTRQEMGPQGCGYLIAER